MTQRNSAKGKKRRKKPEKLEFVQDFIPIKDLRHGIIETTDGRYIKILEIEPINFMLRSDDEQFSIISTFASWLKISPMKLQFKCCMNREDILCTPKDVFRISKKLSISTYDFIKRYCDSYLGDTSHMPIVRIVPHDAAGHCPLLENNKCVVHECKPVVCAMYPIGRTICIDTSVKDPKDMNVKDIEYLFTHPIRCGKTEKHTVREWLTQFGIPIEDEYFIQWHKTISILSPLIQKAITKIRVDSMNQILNIIFVKLYMDYDLEQDFFPQFIANRDMMIKMMNDLPIHGGE